MPASKGKSKSRKTNTEASHTGKDSQEKAPQSTFESSSGDNSAQQTISDLFATSKRSSARAALEQSEASPSKRLKRDRLPLATSHPPSTQAINATEMYSFPSSKPKPVAEVVDLTSPHGSPSKKRINGLMRPSNLAGHTGPKKLVVKNLKTVPKSNPEEYANKVWTQLDTAVSAIFEDEKLPYSLEELYKGVEFSCRQGRAADIWDKFLSKSNAEMRHRAEVATEQIAGLDTDTEALRTVVHAWRRWNRQFDTTRSIFYYLDRSYLLHSSTRPTLQESGTIAFRDLFFLNQSLRPKILQGACDLVSAERKGQLAPEDEALLRESIKMFHNLSIYTKYFEPRLLSESEQYFCSWAEQAIASNDLAGYVDISVNLMSQENGRAGKLGLETTTIKALQTYLDDILIDQRQNKLVAEAPVGDLLAAHNVNVLQQLYSLLQRRYLGEKLRQSFEAFINKRGSEIVFDEKREQEMVPRLLEFKRKLDTVWEKCFQRHEGLGHSLREAFESFINKSKRTNMTWGTDNPKPGEMIAKHVDAILKDGSKAIRASEDTSKAADEEQADSSADEDTEISKSLDQVLDLFRFVHGKAVFEAFYKRDLARRLLLGRSASSDAEKSMLTRLKSECGAGFTHNLEQMFKDIEMAREEIASYKLMITEREQTMSFDLSVNVLSASAWPSYPAVVVNMPEAILHATADFEQHYKQKHTGRKLEWKHALAHCQLKATFPKGNKEIVVSSFQAVVLLAFNGSETMSYADLKATTGLDDNELKRTLQSLACARYRVLRKTPQGKDVNTTDTFAINNTFTHPKYRIKINQIQAKETKAENQATHERVAADRQFETQAAIVRIMKSRKQITHPELVSEVIVATKTRGVLDPADIKKNIEKLIDKDYMERDEEKKNVYNYVA